MYVFRAQLAVALPCVLIACGFLSIFLVFDSQDPNYPSTFPEYQGVPQTLATPAQGAVPSHHENDGIGNSLATMQTPPQQGYHGFPTV
jgi:hypothetical protein